MQLKQFSVNDVISRLTALLQRIAGPEIVFDVQPGTALPEIRADVGLVEQVILNLVVNAREAMPKGGRATIATLLRILDEAGAARVPQAKAGRWVGVRVSDSGGGIPPERLARLFAPAVVAKPAPGSVGVGLAAVQTAMQQQDGWLEVENNLGQGTVLTAWFPVAGVAAPAPVPTPAPTTAAAPAAKGGETILVVEDKESIRLIIRTVLSRKGYRALMANNGEEAAALWEQHRQNIRLLLTDVVMPGGVSGKDLADRLRMERPTLKVVFCSGYGADIIGREVMSAPNNRFLAKPFDIERLATVVREALDATPA